MTGIGANICCCICGARPYPELAPPGTREDFDLLKIRGVWRCSLHRKTRIESDAGPASAKEDKRRAAVATVFDRALDEAIGRVERALDQLLELNSPDDKKYDEEYVEAAGLISEAESALEALRAEGERLRNTAAR
jgi:hypothetical protein